MSIHTIRQGDEEIDVEIPDGPKPSFTGDIPAILGRGAVAIIPGLRENVEYNRYLTHDVPVENPVARTLVNAVPPQYRAAVPFAANTVADLATSMPHPEALDELLGTGKPFPIHNFLPEPKTLRGKLAATGLEFAASALPFAAINARATGAARIQDLKSKLAFAENAETDFKALQKMTPEIQEILRVPPKERSPKMWDALQADWKRSVEEGVKGVQEVIGRERVAFDTRFKSALSNRIPQIRDRFSGWLRNFYKEWGNDFQKIIHGREFTPVEGTNLSSRLRSAVGDAFARRERGAAVTAGESQVLKLADSLEGNTNPVSIQDLYNSLHKDFNPNQPDYAIGRARDALAETLAARGDQEALNFRATYAPLAEMRDKGFDIIQPYAGRYDTKKTVESLHDLVETSSTINPTTAVNTDVLDTQRFLERYREIDPQLVEELNAATRDRKMQNIAMEQVSAGAQNAAKNLEPYWEEKRRQAIETSEETVKRLTQAVTAAKTAVERAQAAGKLQKFLRWTVFGLAGSAAAGAASRLGWEGARKFFRGELSDSAPFSDT